MKSNFFYKSKFSNIYNYRYEYALGSSDVISINLTDTDDIDGSYIIDPNGNIDLPFVGKINIEGLEIYSTKKVIFAVRHESALETILFLAYFQQR